MSDLKNYCHDVILEIDDIILHVLRQVSGRKVM